MAAGCEVAENHYGLHCVWFSPSQCPNVATPAGVWPSVCLTSQISERRTTTRGLTDVSFSPTLESHY